jgi:hypothetical protein
LRSKTVCGKGALYLRYEVNNVREVLNVSKLTHMNVLAVSAEIVSSEVNQHAVLGVLFGILKESLNFLSVLGIISGSEGRSRNRIDTCGPILHHDLSFW